MEKKKKKFRVLSFIGNTVFYVFVFVLLLFSILNLSAKKADDIPSIFGKGIVTVLSNSMDGKEKNSFKKDALVLVDKFDASKRKLVKGDIVVFFGQLDVNDPTVRSFIIHRVIEVNGDLIITQGDNIENKERNITETNNISTIKAVYIAHVEGVGAAINFLRTPTGFAIFVLLPLLILLIVEMFILVKYIINNNKQKLELKHELEKERLKEEILKELKNKE